MMGNYLELGGIVFALLAATPGIIDFFTIVPPNSSAKKRALLHGGLNILMVVIFAAIWFYRKGSSSSHVAVLSAEFTGAILLGITGWLGGTLVYRNQIAVDHRYAAAGKWVEKHFKKEKVIEVGKENELKLNQMMLVHVGDERIAIGRTEQGYVAFADHCTHRGGPLSDGVMICGTVQCPWHGSQFDVNSGELKAGPAKRGIKVYNLKASDGKLILTL
jgi:nitrite reductase/ring-hydroxylating ferredoxin subunit